MQQTRTTLAERVTEYLNQRGGIVTSETGRGLTSEMAAALGTNQGVLNGVLTRMETAGTVTRDVRGRRTFSIALANSAGAAGAARRPAERPRAATPSAVAATERPPRAVERADTGPAPSAALEREVAMVLRELHRLSDTVADQAAAAKALARRVEALESASRARDESPTEGAGRLFRRRRG